MTIKVNIEEKVKFSLSFLFKKSKIGLNINESIEEIIKYAIKTFTWLSIYNTKQIPETYKTAFNIEYDKSNLFTLQIYYLINE